MANRQTPVKEEEGLKGGKEEEGRGGSLQLPGLPAPLAPHPILAHCTAFLPSPRSGSLKTPSCLTLLYLRRQRGKSGHRRGKCLFTRATCLLLFQLRRHHLHYRHSFHPRLPPMAWCMAYNFLLSFILDLRTHLLPFSLA